MLLIYLFMFLTGLPASCSETARFFAIEGKKSRLELIPLVAAPESRGLAVTTRGSTRVKRASSDHSWQHQSQED